MEYIAEKHSRKALRNMANTIRKSLGLEHELYFPVVQLLDVFSEFFDDFSYEIVKDDVFPSNIHADTDISSGHIRIKESVYNRACDGEGRDRMTIAHEIGHYLIIRFFGVKLQRNYNPNAKIPAYMDPEWQAKCFAGELMVSEDLVHDMSPELIAKKCGVSLEAAKIQHSHLH